MFGIDSDWCGLLSRRIGWLGRAHVLAASRYGSKLDAPPVVMGLWLLRSRGAAARSGVSTPAASGGKASQRHHRAAASQTRSRTPPPRPRAASQTRSRTPPPRPGAASQTRSRTPPPLPRAAGSRTPTRQPRKRKRAATDRLEQAAAEAPLRASTPKRVRQRRHADRRNDPELHALVGPACETAEAHEARHPGFGHHQTCPRCRFYKIGQSWVGAYGTVPAPGHGPDSVQWLDERPSHWGGPGDWAASSALTHWQ